MSGLQAEVSPAAPESLPGRCYPGISFCAPPPPDHDVMKVALRASGDRKGSSDGVYSGAFRKKQSILYQD